MGLVCEAQDSFECKCLVYDDTSPNGDPFVGDPSIVGRPASLTRSTVALRALLRSHVCGPSFSDREIASRTPHSLKGTLATVARCAHESQPTQREIGKWDGSSAQSLIDDEAEGVTTIDEHGRDQFAILTVYTSVGAEEGYVPAIMERQLARMRARIADVDAETLPAVGGFAYYAPSVSIQ